MTGALAGGLASIAAASTIAAKTERARDREAVRRELRQRVALLEVALVQAWTQRLSCNEAGTWGRFHFASDVLSTANSLGWWQYRGVRSSMVALVGPVDVKLAETLPARADETLHAEWLAHNAGDFNADELRDRGLLEKVHADATGKATHSAAVAELRRLGRRLGKR